MGQDKANAEFLPHAHGTDPITYDWQIRAHWGDENIDEEATITTAQATDLHDAAVISQTAYDTTADAILTWYGFTSLSSADRLTMRATMRKSCAKSKPV